ncbi:hypothetical protein RJ640_023300 [Escallonia rubra]|uniref:Uncharacterized protein n=1 Tax=Escallonia rubra TaxID=112253 RepID=A0AA88RWL7_9ASTE|nr:hypothetical protein RJ640_023300 [Escallonia rubra]
MRSGSELENSGKELENELIRKKIKEIEARFTEKLTDQKNRTPVRKKQRRTRPISTESMRKTTTTTTTATRSLTKFDFAAKLSFIKQSLYLCNNLLLLGFEMFDSLLSATLSCSLYLVVYSTAAARASPARAVTVKATPAFENALSPPPPPPPKKSPSLSLMKVSCTVLNERKKGGILFSTLTLPLP